MAAGTLKAVVQQRLHAPHCAWRKLHAHEGMTLQLTRPWGRAGEHGEDGGVGMVEGDGVDGAELGQVVLVGRIVAMPGDHIERRERLHRFKHAPAQLVHHHKLHLPVLIPGYRRLKVPGCCQAVGTCKGAATTVSPQSLVAWAGEVGVLTSFQLPGEPQLICPSPHCKEARSLSDLQGEKSLNSAVQHGGAHRQGPGQGG